MKIVKNENGFTLIEMMIVLLIISVLILIAIPNVTKHSATIDEKGCDAYIRMVEGQVQAYKMEKKQRVQLELVVSNSRSSFRLEPQSAVAHDTVALLARRLNRLGPQEHKRIQAILKRDDAK